MTHLEPTHTHLYPGARGRVLSGPSDGPVALSFADGARSFGTLQGDLLTVAAHVTAKGTAIPEKRWRIAVEGTSFSILGRLP